MINCENYQDGFCIYIPKNLSKELVIHEKCPCKNYPIDIIGTMIAECTERKIISKLRKKDEKLEQELLKIK